MDQLELEQEEQIQYLLDQVDTLLESTADEVPRCERQTEADSREFHKMTVALIETMRRALSAEKELEQLHELSQCGQLRIDNLRHENKLLKQQRFAACTSARKLVRFLELQLGTKEPKISLSLRQKLGGRTRRPQEAVIATKLDCTITRVRPSRSL